MMTDTIAPAKPLIERNTGYDERVRQCLMDAAIQCVQDIGLEKVNMRQIAERAGFARQTVYKYYSNKYDIVAEALMREGMLFVQAMSSHISQFNDVDTQFVEAFLYAVENLPQNPVLLLLVAPDNGFISHLGISYHPFGLFGELGFKPVFDQYPALAARAEGISEFWSRNVLSFLTLKGTRERSRDELAEYVRYYLLPGLHLHAISTPG